MAKGRAQNPGTILWWCTWQLALLYYAFATDIRRVMCSSLQLYQLLFELQLKSIIFAPLWYVALCFNVVILRLVATLFFCKRRFQFDAWDKQSSKMRPLSLRNRFLSGLSILSDDVLRRANCLMEVLSVRDGPLHVQQRKATAGGCSRKDVQMIVDELSHSLFYFISFYFILSFCCTTRTISIIICHSLTDSYWSLVTIAAGFFAAIL
jgi:hypothetical protein